MPRRMVATAVVVVEGNGGRCGSGCGGGCGCGAQCGCGYGCGSVVDCQDSGSVGGGGGGGGYFTVYMSSVNSISYHIISVFVST
ncbi:Hypothetical predicted protein [Octopus vulgaris]|uniref:Uncharacterized protein n=1 Tax=Octopus vulgaris TaxID=6645 RepID=A0AA36BRH6_OCTVU|nr:Hypothetical predicted protein [Octopus vulgaris]